MKCKMLLAQFLFFISISYASVMAQGHGTPFPISTEIGLQIYIQAAYNSINHEYLVVWEDYRINNIHSDIYGQFVRDDGSLRGENFIICDQDSSQYWPHLDYDSYANRYLVVFEDYRNGLKNGDIRGIFINNNGKKIKATSSDTDTTFAICSNSSSVYTCSVAFNYSNQKYLVVWGDFRNNSSSYTGDGVYGQIVDQDGTLLGPPDQPDPAVNFPIANNSQFEESVPDVTYHDGTGEWFVVYGTSTGYVLGQRVNNQGKLLYPDGNILAKPGAFGTAMQISNNFENGPDCLQAKVQANNEDDLTSIMAGDIMECTVIWKSKSIARPDNDIYGQRIGFFWDGTNFIAKYIDFNGDTSSVTNSNFEISVQNGWPDPSEIAYSNYDGEFFTAWGDYRNDANGDLYGQRLFCDYSDDNQMWPMNDARNGIVASTENVPYAATSNAEGYIIGIAHDWYKNKFLVAYSFNDNSQSSGTDVYGILVNGTTPTGVDQGEKSKVPQSIVLGQNYPNPFNPETNIRFGIPGNGQVCVSVYDVRGRLVKTLLEKNLQAGFHNVKWDGMNQKGQHVSSGLYFYQISHNSSITTKKMTLIR